MSEFAAGIIKPNLRAGGLTPRSRRRKAICLGVELYIFRKAARRKRSVGKCQRLAQHGGQKAHAVNSSLR